MSADLKIAIWGGMAKQSGGLLDLGKEWHIWGVNGLFPQWLAPAYFRIDKMFHLHKLSDLQHDIPEHLAHFEEWCAKHKEIPIVLLERWAAVPDAEIFPRKQIGNGFPRPDYHCGSFDWLVAYALHLGATNIHLTGIQLRTQSSEPLSSGPCLEYWCGIAEGRGVNVTASDDCDLFWNYRLVRDHRSYGYDSFDLVETLK